MLFDILNKAQPNGSWVLPYSDIYGINYEADRLEFAQNIQSYFLQDISESSYKVSACGYDQNGNLQFYIVGFEMKENADCETVFAWFTRYYYGNADKDKVCFYNLDDDNSFDVITDTIACECTFDPEEDGWAQVLNVQGCNLTQPLTYTWYNESGNILQQGSSNQITGLEPGTYTVCVTDNSFPQQEECQTFQITPDLNLYTYDNWYDIYPSTQNWNNKSYSFKTGIYVHSGANFTITNGYMQFGPDAKVIIERGATLTLDNTIFTYMDDCRCLLKGIEVLGDPNEDQSTQFQGKLTVINNSEINNAEIAVLLAKRGVPAEGNGIDYSFCGGIVQAEGDPGGDNFANYVKFKNNKRVLEAYKYNHGGHDNLSYFKRCKMTLDQNFVNNNVPSNQVYMYFVKGIRFNACRFIDAYNTTPAITAISSLNAVFYAHGISSSQQAPCEWDEYERTYFSNFKYAVNASNTGTTVYTFNIQHCEFSDNITGVRANSVNNIVVLFSKFNIAKNDADQEECEGQGLVPTSFGIDLNQCTGFAIEENSFMPGAGTGVKAGIKIAETEATDEVYKNYFEGLSYGNYAVGVNHKEDDLFKGLAYFCNENTANYADFYVEPDNDQTKISGIQSKQGDDNNVAGNKFTPSGATWHFYNGGDYLVGYYFCDYCSNENPDDNKEFQVTNKPKNFDNGCPSHYGGGGGGSGEGRGLVLTPEEKQEAEMEYSTNLTEYNNVKSLFDNLKDGGNTDATLSDVETAWPDDMWELRTELLGKSPHLSMDVLKKAADKTDVLPDNVIFEIMAANPDELKKEELIKYLEDKENPLPDYMIDILKQVAMGTTYKTVLQKEMSDYNRTKTRAALDIIRSLINDTVTDKQELRNWLDNLGGIRADEQIINTYLEENNYNDALALGNMLPELYKLEGKRLKEHNYLMDMLNLKIELLQQSRSFMELTGDEVSQLNTIADSSESTGGAEARGILEAFYGYSFCDCMNITGDEGYKSVSFDNKNFDKAFGISIIIEPNPAKEWTAFNYTLPSNTSKGTINIFDVMGKAIEKFEVTGLQGQYIWDTRNIKPGVYMYSFVVNGVVNTNKIIIQK